jgi:hypothetical protein
MQLVVIDNGDMRFLTGEVELKACKERYNADAITTAFDHEISILETSGHYQLNNEPSFGYDHIKGAFAALSMLQKVMKTFFYSRIETLCMLKFFFLYARGKKRNTSK